MIVDVHCHIDMLENPEKFIIKNEMNGNFTIGMTNLPSHFSQGKPYFKKLKNLRLALGFHPQLAYKHQEELNSFKVLSEETSYIGEVGLDFSRAFEFSKESQIKAFEFVCDCIKDSKKIVSVHSRQSAKTVLEILKRYSIRNVIFHWYSGPLGLIDNILDEGYYFSINEAMILSESGRKIISRIPINRILTESDAPFNPRSNIENVLSYLNVSNEVIKENFTSLINKLRM